MINRNIPSSGKAIPVIGLGTWQTFDVGKDSYPRLVNILQQMHTSGGRLIDSSPMYGNAEKAVGDITSGMETSADFFYATKVWTTGKQEGILQMETSMKEIHNLLDWKTHLATLKQWKQAGKIRYIGITHYTDDMHGELENILRKEPIDFVQFNYSIQNTHAEKRLLPASADMGIATLINRPFGTGNLFHHVKGKALPLWSAELGIKSWAAYFLKYIISHPAVACVIPATGNPDHAVNNFDGGVGRLPGEKERKRMEVYFREL